MKFRLYSDLHLDSYPTAESMWVPPPLPDDLDSTLIIAGDVWIGTRFLEFGGSSWIAKVSQQFKHVLIVLGNHDYWPCEGGLTIKNAGDRCNALLQDYGYYNVTVLDQMTHQDGDVLVVGATLWTDMNKEDPLTMMNMTHSMRYDGEIAFEKDGGPGDRFHSERWVDLHRHHREYIRIIASQNPDKQIMVITHHAPLLSLIDPQFKDDFTNAYYVSDLSDLILDYPNIVFWGFGHVHNPVDTMMVDCRFINNSVGYRSQHAKMSLKTKHETLEIKARCHPSLKY